MMKRRAILLLVSLGAALIVASGAALAKAVDGTKATTRSLALVRPTT
jgi:hypothetical protein